MNTAVRVNLLGLATASGPHFAIAAAPVHGLATIQGGLLSYTPAQNYVGADQLSVSASDLSGATATAQIAITVTPPDIPPDPAVLAPPIDTTVATDIFQSTSFLFTGPNAIQTGVAPGTIDPQRVAIVRGRVLTRDQQPLSGVTIAVHDHPEYGQTITRLDGRFDLAVNGGGALTLDYRRAAFLDAQRLVSLPWRDYVTVPDVVLVGLDPQVTTLALSGSTGLQVAQGSPVTDADGTRRATLLVPAGVQASMTLPDGSQQALPSASIRATEYTVGAAGPDAMPATLPPASGYTYAVEYRVDEAQAAGATGVQFSAPVYHYVENFLNFPVGGVVPSGSYDRAAAAWVPEPNGRVVKIVSVSSQKAELDTDGDGLADNDPALGITDAERATLAARYQAGQSLWRVPITHFSTWDFNWPYRPPNGAKGPKLPIPARQAKPGAQPANRPLDKPKVKCRSIIECENQILGEALPLTGSALSLHYQSDRALGYVAQNKLVIPLSGATMPPDAKRIDLEVQIGGSIFTRSFPPTPNQQYVFAWDGRDPYGRAMQGSFQATVRVGYVYDGVYTRPEDRPEGYDQAFGHFTYYGTPVSADATRQEVTLWQEWYDQIGKWASLSEGLGGWSLSAHHVYDPVGRVLYLGDGSRRDVSGLNGVIQATTAYNTGTSDYRAGDGGAVGQAALIAPRDIAYAPDGSLYISQSGNFYDPSIIRRVDPSGTITTIAGGPQGFSGDGGPALQAQFNGANSLAVGPDGSLYIADYDNHRVRRIDRQGVINTVAGSGPAGDFNYTPVGGLGDGGPATAARLTTPTGIAVTPDGALYIADSGDYRIRRVGPDGIITTIAGTGQPASQQGAGDGGPALQAQFQFLQRLAADRQGNLYVLDQRVVRRISPDGFITTVVGGAPCNFQQYETCVGDGSPATAMTLGNPNSLAVDSTQAIYVGDAGRVRFVDSDGVARTIAGNRQSCGGAACGDGSAATQASFAGYLVGVAVKADGTVQVIDYNNSRLRAIAPPLPGFSRTDLAIPSEDGSLIYQFDSAGRHLRTVSAMTGATVYRFAYDSAGRLVGITDTEGNSTTIEHDAAGHPTAIVAPYGQRTALLVDANGYLARVTNPAGEQVSLTNSATGLLTEMADPRGGVHQFSYDADGRLLRDADPANGAEQLARADQGAGYLVTRTNSLSQVTSYTVTQLPTGDQQRTVTAPDGTVTVTTSGVNGTQRIVTPDGSTAVTTESGDPRFGTQAPVRTSQVITTPAGLRSTVTATRTVSLADPRNPLSLQALTETVNLNGEIYATTYVSSTRRLTTTTPAGRQSFLTIDAQGRPTQQALTGFDPVALSYDARGRLVSVSQGSGPAARTISYSYTSQGYLDTVTDPLGRTVRYSYDAAGRVTQTMLPDGQVVGMAYDASGNLVGLTPPGRAAHTIGYNAVDLPTSSTPPAAGAGSWQTQISYNADRRPTQIALPDGRTVALSYDAAGRLSATTTARGVSAYSYSATGQVSAIAAPGNIGLAYSYDGMLPLGETISGPVSGSVSYAYDNRLRATSQQVNGGSAVSYQYDADGLLTGVGAMTIARSAQHGLRTGSTIGTITDSQSYSTFGELAGYSASAGATGLYSVAYTRDKLGRIAQKVETIGGTTTTYDYTYDLAGRLAQVARDGNPVEQYSYDANGNRLSATVSGVTVSGTYDAQDRLTQYGAATYSYAAAGDLQARTVAGQTTSYTYDALGNLTQVTLPSGKQIGYLIDGRNRRVGRRVDGVLAQAWLYQGQLAPVAEIDGSGALVSRFVYSGMGRAPEYMVKGGITYRLITDQIGSVRLVVNVATGGVAQRIDYDSFGNVVQDTSPGFQPFGFAGGLYDRDTGLTRFGARDYDPQVGRWTAKDPIGFAGGDTNLYGYVRGDPVNLVDPSGHGYWAQGPLIVFGITIPASLSSGPNADRANLQTVHEHYFSDNGSNLGFGSDSTLFNLPNEARQDYHRTSEEFDDNLMFQAMSNVYNRDHSYRLFGWNCQDYAEAARQEYYRLKHEEEQKQDCDSASEWGGTSDVGSADASDLIPCPPGVLCARISN